MLKKQLTVGLLALQGTSAVGLQGDKPTSNEGLEWKLRELNKNIGNLKYTRPHEAEVFDLGGILNDFYGQVGKNYGN